MIDDDSDHGDDDDDDADADAGDDVAVIDEKGMETGSAHILILNIVS